MVVMEGEGDERIARLKSRENADQNQVKTEDRRS